MEKQVDIPPYKRIEMLIEKYSHQSDDEILTMLANLPTLPDDDRGSVYWLTENAPCWKDAEQLVALADVVAERHLRVALPLIYERLCYGDPGEMMRGIYHPIERTVQKDWDYLTKVCIEVVQSSHQKGARVWAIFELGRLRDPQTLPVLLASLKEPHGFIVCQAAKSLFNTCHTNSDCRQIGIQALTDLANNWNFEQGNWCSVKSIWKYISEIGQMTD